MALPASGPISMSMINEELSNSATAKLSFQDIATSFELSAPNYDDSVAGLSLGELYGDSVGSSATATFEDFGITGFSVNTQNGSITSNPVATGGSSPVPSLTVSYVSSPFSAVLTNTTRTANVSFTCPAESATGVTYTNAGSTISGTVTSTQGAYQLEYDDWTGGIANINPNTGVVTITPGNDSNTGIGAISNTTTFSQTSNASPSAGQVFFTPTSFGTVGVATSQTVNFTLGVPSTNLDGSGGQYGNVGGTVTGTKTFTQQPNETVSLSGEGVGTDPLQWTSNQSGTSVRKSISIDVNAESVGWSAAVVQADSDDNPGMVDLEFEISTNSDGSGASFSISGLSGDDVIYAFPTASNSSVSKRLAVVSVTTDAGANDTVGLEQSGQVTFTSNPSPGSGDEMVFTHSGSLSSGDNTIDLTSNLAWNASITGSQFTFYEGSNFSNLNNNPKTGTGNENFSIFAAGNTGAKKFGTFDIGSTTAGTSEHLQFNISQQPRPVDSGIFTNLSGAWSGSFGSLVLVSRNITQIANNPYHYSPTYFPIAVQTNYATTYSVSANSTTYGALSTNFDSSGNGAGSQTLTGLSTTTSTPTSNAQTQFFFNSKTEAQHGSTRLVILTFTFPNSSGTDELRINLIGSGDDGGDPGGPPEP
tara:strand:- start:3046 stop:4986 length:1941 start_codon:yes stop_codon:yes gene_type:complete